ncbi:crotonobetainyl-CoA:carnitine CoA-transferase CaiB-like acyl-CoA transferase [Inquilinus ginsengisoli]|uniref:Crotonobetainyl-CoA:carnitine CoA-transferase CaiB-like acyl-CoA transferase n=1 Tax=Inquilinus ginsengisoli TaxID=363840 RepID=A0ABU1JGQ8_9PROT|nr:CoA transferase [Inquilinus ginsengisoli]MDR6287808.1 crotonobetainyl-CoA:carnitine CoA-transferase CaiB-like acyl-CoA transferase [Inquilinus ginsengisoli]
MMAAGSLDGLRVLDLSRILAGPTATQLLADLGAEVIKVERPGEGDDTRGWGPPFVPGPDGGDSDISAYFLCANRGKRSIAIDLATAEGAALVRRLAAVSDVVVENYKPGDLARYGLAYEDLRRVKPDIVWCAISGFGQTGPYADRIGYDFLVQAMGGIMSITGDPAGAPAKVGVGIADVMCGMYATVGILAALRHRDRTGEGQYIDLSLYDAQVSWLVNAATNHLVSGAVPRRLGNRHPNIAPYQTFAAADGHIVVAVGNDAQFARFAAVIGRPELAEDDRFRRNRDRVVNVDALDDLIAPELLRQPAAAWIEWLTAAAVPAGPVAGIDQVLADPHTLAREMVVTLDRDDGPPVRVLGNPLKLSATPVRLDRAPPHLDQDRAEVLAMLAEREAAE